jgi:hypothetical protein
MEELLYLGIKLGDDLVKCGSKIHKIRVKIEHQINLLEAPDDPVVELK